MQKAEHSVSFHLHDGRDLINYFVFGKLLVSSLLRSAGLSRMESLYNNFLQLRFCQFLLMISVITSEGPNSSSL